MEKDPTTDEIKTRWSGIPGVYNYYADGFSNGGATKNKRMEVLIASSKQ